MLRGFLTLSGRILDGVSESFSPPSGASARQVRINGAIAVGAGVLCFVLGVPALILVGGKLSTVALAPILAGYAFLLVGGYRLVFGASAKSGPDEVMSLYRILFGIGWLALMFGVPMLVIILLIGWN